MKKCSQKTQKFIISGVNFSLVSIMLKMLVHCGHNGAENLGRLMKVIPSCRLAEWCSNSM